MADTRLLAPLMADPRLLALDEHLSPTLSLDFCRLNSVENLLAIFSLPLLDSLGSFEVVLFFFRVGNLTANLTFLILTPNST